MKRRHFLKIAAAATALSALPQPPYSLAAKALTRTRPGDASWPDAQEWAHLAQRLKGRLVKPRPIVAVADIDPASRSGAATLEQLRNPFYLQDSPGAAQSQGWMGAWTYQNSTYAVEAESAADIAAAVKFAKQHNLRVVIKGGGHDYLGRSNAPDSLLIWTHKMRQTRFMEDFVPAGAPLGQGGVPAVMVSAGTRWLEAYGEATTKNNRYIQGGGCTSVGAAGGFIQGGGFGSFSKKFGTGAAGLLEAEVVTADGQILVANSFQNDDLFWALRGGGGGTFGVVTRLVLKAHDLPGSFGLLQGTIRAKDDASFKQLLKRFIPFYRDHINNEHWGEQIAFRDNNSVELYLVFQGLSAAQAEQVWEPLRSWTESSQRGVQGEERFEHFSMTTKFWEIPPRKMWDPTFWDEHHPGFVTRDPRKEAPKGQFWWSGNHGEASKYWYAYQSWWLPAELFAPAQSDRLADMLFEASRVGSVTLHINKGLAGGSPQAIESGRDTCVHPSAYTSSALVIMASGSNEVFTGVKGREPDLKAGRERAGKIGKAMAMFVNAAPSAGAYANEADYFQKNWQQAFWGSHYRRLLEIKQKYDPDGLFYGHHNVGSEFWSDDGMTRIK